MQDPTGATRYPGYQPAPPPDLAVLTEGALGRRFVAYALDLMIVFGLTLVVGFAVLVFGLITFGLAWALFAILVPGTAILYSAVTVGGPNQGTVGMRLAGLRVVDATTGRGTDMLSAGVHALLFYVAASTLVLLAVDLLIGFARRDARLGHDVLAGLVAIRR
ncbi:MAG TPA: RDD family protein [Salinarimonas sp.]|nr:RDD family protein [Salinarimonas sp.]